jgi:serine/threonine-protein kinase RsbW
MEITLALTLPRDELSLPVVRHICKDALKTCGVERDSIDAIEVALSEACSNVLKHSDASDQYEVHASIDDEKCVIRVVDAGRGFDHGSLAVDGADSTAEGGRGIALMRALIDDVRFESEPESGTVVRLVKRLDYEDHAPILRLSGD